MLYTLFDQTTALEKDETAFRVVDLFAGAGGFSLAARHCNAEVVFAVENDPNAVKTYKENFSSLSKGKKTVLYDTCIQKLSA